MAPGDSGNRWRRRLAVATVALLAAAALTAGATAAEAQHDPQVACVNGWSNAGRPSAVINATAVDVTEIDGTPWVAGSENTANRGTLPFTAVATNGSWKEVPLARVSGESLLTAIATAGTNKLWVSGERIGDETQPLIEHWDGISWHASPVPVLPNGGALTDVAQVTAQQALAVGFKSGPTGVQQVVYARNGVRWQRVRTPHVGSSGLTGVSAAPDATTWAVGWLRSQDGFRPLVERWDGASWRRGAFHGIGSIVLTGVSVLSDRNAWAVGYREVSGTLRAIAAHWNGLDWALEQNLATPSAGGSILRDVAIVHGKVTAVGAMWSRSSLATMPFVTQLVNGTWVNSIRVAGIRTGELLGIDGGRRQVAVGYTPGHTAAIVPCASSVARSSDAHSSSNGSSPSVAVTMDGLQRSIVPDGSSGTASGSAGAGSPSLSQRIPGLQVVDVTQSAGLAMTTIAYSGEATDLDRDGWPDLVIGRHGLPMLLLRNGGDGTFRKVSNGFRQADRHGCAAGNLDGDPQPELVCAIGADHGQRLKDNEVWLSPLDPTQRTAADALGLADPLGRGRLTALLDYDRDGRQDVYIANDPDRPDGLPSSNRLFRNTGSTFRSAPTAGLDLPVGARCLVASDLDRDGWPDLLDCESIPMAAYRSLHVFHNVHGVFEDWTRRLGLGGNSIFDAAVGDLNHDGRRDLVTLAFGRMDVWLQSGGRFREVLELRVTHVVSVALADVNGDGSPDIYVVRGEHDGAPLQDLMLLNDSTGTRYTSVALPSAQPGPGVGAITVDYDRNGKDDLLVMHGNGKQQGPIQLLAFGPPWPFGAPPPP